ncbi:hypothetical protein Y1Q_0023291 [Alligator mississippiensis]|uniref:Uncharacterized protein n=1 Tax=Alligator mississippiensis TaxID=8496 RepID=A0A151MJA9_ALLMI|nr:hypothetical protein Y1Q_0023291 [Alligator mississippiensis]
MLAALLLEQNPSRNQAFPTTCFSCAWSFYGQYHQKTISSLPCCLSDLCLRRSKCCPPNLSKGGLKSRWPNLQNIQG